MMHNTDNLNFADSKKIIFDSRLLVYTHIPKCGGTTIDRLLIDMFGPNKHLRIDFAAGREHRLPINLDETTRNSVQIVSGHFGFDCRDLDAFDREILYIATVRDPISRIISFYKFMLSKYGGTTTGKGLFFDRPIQQVVKDFIRTNHPIVRNQQCHYLGGTDFKTARQNIKDNYLYVSDIGDLSDLIELILPLSPALTAPKMVIHKKSSASEVTLESDILQDLKKLTADDLDLVSWLKETKQSRLSLATSRVKSLLRQDI